MASGTDVVINDRPIGDIGLMFVAEVMATGVTTSVGRMAKALIVTAKALTSASLRTPAARKLTPRAARMIR